MASLDNAVISASLEDYLKAVFILQQQKEAVRMTDIAEILKVSRPSVTRAIGTLKESGFLNHETYGEITLTNTGNSHAKAILRRHELLKDFLNVTLGVTSDNAEKDACKMEHIMSNESIEKLSKFFSSLNNKDN